MGKTMLAVGLGHAAVADGYRTYYPTAADLAARCHKAAIEGRWATTMRFSPAPAADHRSMPILELCRGSCSVTRRRGPGLRDCFCQEAGPGR